MKGSIAMLFLAVAVVLVSGCTGTTTNTGGNQQTGENTVQITANGFSPQTITIQQGESVTWTNQDSAAHWPASAMHPTHAVYPEGGGCIGSAFDACKGLAQGESFTFTFNQQGEWKYHDHLNPSTFGTVVVE